MKKFLIAWTLMLISVGIFLSAGFGIGVLFKNNPVIGATVYLVLVSAFLAFIGTRKA